MKTPDALRNEDKAHGLRGQSYKVEFSSDPNPSEFASGEGEWTQREVMLDQVQIGYGAQEYTASLRMWDKDSVEAPHLTGDKRAEALKTPANGELIRIWYFDTESATPAEGRLIFKGAIRSVNERRTASGIQWVCEAISEVSRLNDTNVTFTSNLHNDPINPAPVFDPVTGFQTVAQLRTVAQLIKMILDFPDVWGTQEYFRYSDIDWGTLENDVKCGGFVPTNVVFESTRKGEAITELLQRAGNFDFMYVPQKDGHDKLKIVEFNLLCNRVGDKWDTRFASLDKSDVIAQPTYAYEKNVIEDATEWSTKQTANVVRFVSAPIRFYSGHYLVPEYVEAYTIPADPTAGTPEVNYDPMTNFVAEGNKLNSIDAQWARVNNFEGIPFRFDDPYGVVDDKRKTKNLVVGMPLFPDWNVHEDFLPHMFQLGHVIIASATAPKDTAGADMNKDYYNGLPEFSHAMWGDIIAQGTTATARQNNLHAYQAWYATKECPACKGTGAVKAVYSGTDNEPVLKFYAVTPKSRREITPPMFKIKTGEKVEVRVQNYIFDPAHFGEIDPNTGDLYPMGALTQFVPSDSQPYPLPWKNLCPYCRGVGLKPEWKIRNIQQNLFNARSNQNTANPENNADIPLDPEETSTGPETWQQAQNRITYQSGPFLQIEMSLNMEIPNDATLIKKNWRELVKAVNANPKNWAKKFPHPLQFKNIKKLIPQRAAVSDDASKLLADPDWSCTVPYTKIVCYPSTQYQIDYEMGRVLFHQPMFIPCKKPYKGYRWDATKKCHIVDKNGHVMMSPAQNYMTHDGLGVGFWRPPRVWMSFFYAKDRFFDQLKKKGNGDDTGVTTVEFTNADGQTSKYDMKAMIVNGHYVLEVKKNRPIVDETTTQFGTGNRLIQTCITDTHQMLEVFDKDLPEMTVLPQMMMEPAQIETAKKAANLEYPIGRLFRYDMTSPGEKQREMEGYGSEDYRSSIFRPKMFRWRLKDNRNKMMEIAVKKLESCNAVTVSGTLKLDRTSVDFTHGLGYVDYPDRAKAVVKRATYNFGEGCQVSLELSREQARFGEMPPDDKNIQTQLMKDVTRLKRFADMQESMGQTASMDNVPVAADPNHGRDLGSDTHAKMFVR